MLVLAVRSIHSLWRGAAGAIALLALACVLAVSGSSSFVPPNTPLTLVDREFALEAVGRLTSVLAGNAANEHGVTVYMTNIGAYATNILRYYMMKRNPVLDWGFYYRFPGTEARDHIDFIRESRSDFVIAGQFDNGLTYSRWSAHSEEASLAAMRQDPNYMAVDRFYGPHGRSVTVFQRRWRFAGWRAIAGIANPTQTRDEPRPSTGTVTYLQSFAARPVRAALHIDCAGPVGQTITVLVNQEKVAELTMDQGSALLDQDISLSAGTNDIVLQYSTGATVTFRRLMIEPHLPVQG